MQLQILLEGRETRRVYQAACSNGMVAELPHTASRSRGGYCPHTYTQARGIKRMRKKINEEKVPRANAVGSVP